jgi:hypothetical protein
LNSGGVPYLNDYLISHFDFDLYNVKFSELLNYLDIFDKFDKHLKNNKKDELTSGENLLSHFFKLPNVYLSFMDNSNEKEDTGSNEEHIYYMHTNTGKAKISTMDYLKYLTLLNPAYVVTPHEYVYITHI